MHKEGQSGHPNKHVFVTYALKLSLPCNCGELLILRLGTIAIESFMWVKPEKNNAKYIQETVTSELFFAIDELGGKGSGRKTHLNTQPDTSLDNYLYSRLVGPCDDHEPVARSAAF